MTMAVTIAAACAVCADGVPEVTDVTWKQDSTRAVTITYMLTNAPAVVTLDIMTNGPAGWVSIGGQNIDCFSRDSAVWRRVDPSETEKRTIIWHPDQSWPDHKIPLKEGGAKAVVTAWALDDTPDYMVVDISGSATPLSQRYYPSVDFLPGGLLENDAYRTSNLVMRKIRAKNVRWTMGTISEKGRNADTEKTHEVMLTNNYYIGVFEVTQAQLYLIAGINGASYQMEGAMRPAGGVSFNALRCNSANTGTCPCVGGNWPDAPYEGSVLGILNARTGLDFDLPGEAQWEFACRAGNGEGRWGDGSPILESDYDPNLPGRYKNNGGNVLNTAEPPSFVLPPYSSTPENGPATAGSYAPNAWGLYDMHGNAFEICLDWFENDITQLNGAINIDPANPLYTLGGNAGAARVRRGGSYHAARSDCRSGFRLGADPSSVAGEMWGFRLTCRAGLK